jgi:hypothetical protein
MNRVRFIKSIAKYIGSKIKSEHNDPNPNLKSDKIAMDNPVAYKKVTGKVPPFDSKNQRFDMTDTHSEVKNDRERSDFLEGKDNVFQVNNANEKINEKNAKSSKTQDKISENPERQISS